MQWVDDNLLASLRILHDLAAFDRGTSVCRATFGDAVAIQVRTSSVGHADNQPPCPRLDGFLNIATNAIASLRIEHIKTRSLRARGANTWSVQTVHPARPFLRPADMIPLALSHPVDIRLAIFRPCKVLNVSANPCRYGKFPCVINAVARKAWDVNEGVFSIETQKVLSRFWRGIHGFRSQA